MPTILAHMLRERGINCITTQEAGNIGRSDDYQLAYATSQNRALVTFNRKHFLALATLWGATGRPHAGLILSKQLRVPEMLRQLLRLVTRHKKESLTNQVLWLQNYKDAPLA